MIAMYDSTKSKPSAVTVKSGTNYSTAEDVRFARLYRHITSDPIIGSEKNSGTYHSRIYEHYKHIKRKDAFLRPFSSIETRFRNVQTICARFSACFASVKATNYSNVSEEDVIRLATALFNKRDIQHPHEDVRRAFKYIQAW